MKKKIIPLFDRVIVEVVDIPQKQLKSGIILPATNNTDVVIQGKVIAIGKGRWNEDGDKKIPLSVEVGDIVLFSKYGFDEIEMEDKKYLIGREDQLLSVLK